MRVKIPNEVKITIDWAEDTPDNIPNTLIIDFKKDNYDKYSLVGIDFVDDDNTEDILAAEIETKLGDYRYKKITWEFGYSLNWYRRDAYDFLHLDDWDEDDIQENIDSGRFKIKQKNN